MRRLSVPFFALALVAAVDACEESTVNTAGLDFDLDGSAFDATRDTSRPDTAAPNDAPNDAPAEAAPESDAGADAAIEDAAIEDASDAADTGPDAAEPVEAGSDASDAALADAGADAGPILVGTGFGKVLSVVANSTDVYFTTYGTTSAGGTYNKDGTVVRCPIAGGCAASSTVLASGLDNPLFVAIEGSTLLIGSAGAVGSGKQDGYVYSCPLTGCGVNNASRITLSPALQNLGGITARNGYAYWVHTRTDSTCGRALFDGGGQQHLGNSNMVSSVGVTVDDANAYWTHTYYPPAIHVAPFTGDGGRILVDIVARDGGLSPQSLTHDNGYLYYVSVLADNVNRVRVDGTGLETLASGLRGPFWLAVDATHVWVADYYSPYAIRRIPKSGGPATVAANSAAHMSWLAVNDTSVFWSTITGQVWRIPK